LLTIETVGWAVLMPVPITARTGCATGGHQPRSYIRHKRATLEYGVDNNMHTSVLLDESVTALAISATGSYVDATFGRGGHSRAILEQLGPDGRLMGVDKDPQAIESGEALAGDDDRFSMVHGSFSELDQWLKPASIDGILLDLGVSSPQLDQAERGFSFMKDGPLDMRMDNSSGQSAAEWLASEEASQIADVLWQYGDERKSRQIAQRIVARRQDAPISTTAELAELIAGVLGHRPGQKHPATRSFQAIRIHVNQELNDLRCVLDHSLSLLKPQGRLVVISFHSLEDRMVKQFIRKHARPPQGNRRLPIQQEVQMPLREIGKPVRASDAELDQNPRARSAVLRIAECVGLTSDSSSGGLH